MEAIPQWEMKFTRAGAVILTSFCNPSTRLPGSDGEGAAPCHVSQQRTMQCPSDTNLPLQKPPTMHCLSLEDMDTITVTTLGIILRKTNNSLTSDRSVHHPPPKKSLLSNPGAGKKKQHHLTRNHKSPPSFSP